MVERTSAGTGCFLLAYSEKCRGGRPGSGPQSIFLRVAVPSGFHNLWGSTARCTYSGVHDIGNISALPPDTGRHVVAVGSPLRVGISISCWYWTSTISSSIDISPRAMACASCASAIYWYTHAPQWNALCSRLVKFQQVRRLRRFQPRYPQTLSPFRHRRCFFFFSNPVNQPMWVSRRRFRRGSHRSRWVAGIVGMRCGTAWFRPFLRRYSAPTTMET